MKLFKSIFLGIFTSLLLNNTNSFAETCGKIDIGPVLLHVDVLESGKTVKKINMPGIKADTPFLVWEGICLKPSFLYAGEGNTSIWSAGCGIGHYTPITGNFSVTPIVGVTYTSFKTTFHFPLEPGVTLDLREKFRSISPYVSLEATYTICKGLRLTGVYQYVWSHSDTVIKGMGTTKSNPKGSNYGLVAEYDLNQRWSINVGAAYNESLTKEKHGLRGYGGRLGFAFWF